MQSSVDTTNIVTRQALIVSSIQEKLLDAVVRGDWSATEQWGKYLHNCVLILTHLDQYNMELKEKIVLFQKAIAERDARISSLEAENAALKSDDNSDKSRIVELEAAQKTADDLLASLGLS